MTTTRHVPKETTETKLQKSIELSVERCPKHLQTTFHNILTEVLSKSNQFWWGCLIGIRNNKSIERIRLERYERVEQFKDFKPICKVKYRKNNETKGTISVVYKL